VDRLYEMTYAHWEETIGKSRFMQDLQAGKLDYLAFFLKEPAARRGSRDPSWLPRTIWRTVSPHPRIMLLIGRRTHV
jgi:hypothetical protein